MELGPIGHTKMKGATKHKSGPLETVTIEGWNQDRWIFIRYVGFNTIQSYQVITGHPTNNRFGKILSLIKQRNFNKGAFTPVVTDSL
jgi:hypothetical protein